MKSKLTIEGVNQEVINQVLEAKRVQEIELLEAKKVAAKSETMTISVRKKTDLGYEYEQQQMKFGLIGENRPIKSAEVHKYTQKIQNGKYQPDLQPIVVMKATELVGQYNLTDLVGNPISEADLQNFLIILDGQHRVSAFAKLNSVKSPKDKIIVPDVLIKEGLEDVREYLVELNTVGRSWDTTDKLCVASISTDNKVLQKITELIKEGFNPTAAVTLCTNGSRLSPKQIKDALSGHLCKSILDGEEHLENVEKYKVEGMAIKGMTAKMLSKRYFINGFISYIEVSGDATLAFKALRSLTLENFKEIKNEVEFVRMLKNINATVEKSAA